MTSPGPRSPDLDDGVRVAVEVVVVPRLPLLVDDGKASGVERGVHGVKLGTHVRVDLHKGGLRLSGVVCADEPERHGALDERTERCLRSAAV